MQVNAAYEKHQSYLALNFLCHFALPIDECLGVSLSDTFDTIERRAFDACLVRDIFKGKAESHLQRFYTFWTL